ncbi:136_t:CDS:2, partial [Ambispora leptoticha]
DINRAHGFQMFWCQDKNEKSQLANNNAADMKPSIVKDFNHPLRVLLDFLAQK